MRTETARLYKDLLSLQGHAVESIHDEATGLSPARRRQATTHWFDSFLLLGGHDEDLHIPSDAIVSPEKINIGRCATC